MTTTQRIERQMIVIDTAMENINDKIDNIKEDTTDPAELERLEMLYDKLYALQDERDVLEYRLEALEDNVSAYAYQY